jgi:xanthine/uracil/vitamin C permease (AzgA family)
MGIIETMKEAALELANTIYLNLKWSEPMDAKFQRACGAEFIAMLLFVVLACGGAMTTLHEANPNLVEIAMSFGFGIMVIAQLVGPLSGGHINCAVSFALFLGDLHTYMHTDRSIEPAELSSHLPPTTI